MALELLERYFTLPDDLIRASAHATRAEAYLALGREADAIASYEAALACEAAFVNIQTEAWLALRFLIAPLGLRAHFARALEVLELGADERLIFPAQRFQWHTAHALIAAASRDTSVAREHAERALEAAACERSGLRHHADVGLVSRGHDVWLERLAALRDAR